MSADDRRALFLERDHCAERVQVLKAELAEAQGELARANMALNHAPSPGRPYTARMLNSIHEQPYYTTKP